MISRTLLANGISSNIQVILATKQAKPTVATVVKKTVICLRDIIVLEEVTVADRRCQLLRRDASKHSNQIQCRRLVENLTDVALRASLEHILLFIGEKGAVDPHNSFQHTYNILKAIAATP